MNALLVGGAVRDRLLGRDPAERDWVVVGATPAAMLAAGFRPVGKDFPVFLHPDSGEEYALARTERKSAPGHTGFVFHADPEVTLEEDLRRRDLTINAMAEDAEGRIVDPWGGRADLQARVLRHVSPAFVEDPLRVLRVARFAAELAPFGFVVAPDTLALMGELARSGELATLSGERVWRELSRALKSSRPSRFLRVLREAGALGALLPEVDALYGVPQVAAYHPEIDTGDHLERVLDQAARLAPGDEVIGFAALVHDLGKGVTPTAELPAHHGHEEAGLPLVDALAARVKAPREHVELGRLVCREHLNVHRALELRAGSVVDLLERLDAWRRPQRFEQALLACEADKRGRLGREDDDYPPRAWLLRCLEAARKVDAAALAGTANGDGQAIRTRLREARA
ncbi:MAG TPA: multifunctional CCA addition/repair protein, partial [Xanthomonadaceae bacterium]|nr:multifunctional CCA addition/repair protein [Xanthomonadaceae bacterium]